MTTLSTATLTRPSSADRVSRYVARPCWAQLAFRLETGEIMATYEEIRYCAYCVLPFKVPYTSPKMSCCPDHAARTATWNKWVREGQDVRHAPKQLPTMPKAELLSGFAA